MRILLLLPDGHIHRLAFGRFTRSMREAPLTLTMLAALAPAELDIEFTLVDESIDRVPLGFPCDLVGISAITGTAPRAYALADHFRARGIPVVIGGVHATILPDEVQAHADCVLSGPAERTWPQFLRDFAGGSFQPRYTERADYCGETLTLPVPRRDLQRTSGYMMPNTIVATRGCRHACSFCSIPAAWPGYARRPVADVVADILTIPSRYLAFNDVSIADDREYAKELFTAMIPLKRQWGGLATAAVVRDEELLTLMARSGCRYLLIGFESLSQPALLEIRKGFNSEDLAQECVEKLHACDISVQGCFIFGMDHDDRTVFEATVQRVQDLKIDIPRYSLLTPYPGTELHRRLHEAGRILSYDWGDYDTMHVVIEPLKMTPAELYEGFKWAYRETFTLRNILRRTASLQLRGVINGVGNLAYRRFVHRLDHHPRYAWPCSALAPGGAGRGAAVRGRAPCRT